MGGHWGSDSPAHPTGVGATAPFARGCPLLRSPFVLLVNDTPEPEEPP